MRYKDNKCAAVVCWCVVLSLGIAFLAAAGPALAGEKDSLKPEKVKTRAKTSRSEGLPRPPARGPMGRGQMPPEIAQRFGTEDINELIEVVRVWRLSRELELTEEQALKLLISNDKHREATQKMRQQQQRLITELRKAVREGGKREATEDILEKIDALDERRVRAELDHQQQMLDGMNIEQKAKYYLFRSRFDQDVRKLIGQIMQKRHAAGRTKLPGPGGPPAGPRPRERQREPGSRPSAPSAP